MAAFQMEWNGMLQKSEPDCFLSWSLITMTLEVQKWFKKKKVILSIKDGKQEMEEHLQS